MQMDTTASRFLRPTDVNRVRRNQRRIQIQRLLIVVRNAIFVAGLAVVAMWAWRHTQSDERFAVRTIEIDGVVHTPRAVLELMTRHYIGLNLFQIDLARVQHDLGDVGWVRRIDIEKKLPDTLRIKVTERTPVALVRVDGALRYVDDDGVAFADLSPSVGDDDLPLISEARGAELTRTVEVLRMLRTRHRELYSRISEIWPVAPRGFAVYDRSLGAVVYVNGDDGAAKWRDLYAVLSAEGNPKIEYADLRFADRLVVKPAQLMASAAVPARLAGTEPVMRSPTEGVDHGKN